jgi:methylmalonyl-CoA mutase
MFLKVHSDPVLRNFEKRTLTPVPMEVVKSHSLGQISHALCDVGGEYRRNM